MTVLTATNTAVIERLPRLGQISFANALPVTLPIARHYLKVEAEITYANPSELNEGFASGQLDLGAMSSHFYLQERNFTLIDGLSISSDGPSGSVLFFSKVGPHKLNQSVVSVPASSATSVNLLKVLLIEQMDVRPRFVVEVEPDLEASDVDAALVIGDQALSVDRGWSNRYWRADLGQWWSSQTGLPMVFGIWAARTDWAESHPEQFSSLCQSLNQSRKMGLADLLPMVIAEAVRLTGLEPYRLIEYYEERLCFDLTARHRLGLSTFHELCLKHGLLGARTESIKITDRSAAPGV